MSGRRGTRLAGRWPALCLITKARTPLRLEGLPRLKDLQISARPGLAGVHASATALENLILWDFAAEDLSVLDGLVALARFGVGEGSRAMRSLNGVQGSPGLKSFSIAVTGCVDLSPLGGLRHLQDMGLVWEPARDSGEPIDLTPLAGAVQLNALVLDGAGPIRGAAALMRLPFLRRLNARRVVDTDGAFDDLLRLTESRRRQEP